MSKVDYQNSVPPQKKPVLKMLKGRVRNFWKPMLTFEIIKSNTTLPQKGLVPILIDLPHIYVAYAT